MQTDRVRRGNWGYIGKENGNYYLGLLLRAFLAVFGENKSNHVVLKCFCTEHMDTILLHNIKKRM